jgi:hypothetical protein
LVWRLVKDGFATLTELETHYSLTDAAKANDVLDAFAEAEAKARKQQ